MPATAQPYIVREADPDTNETWLLLRLDDPEVDYIEVGYIDIAGCSDELWIMEVAIHPAFRGRGFATRLLKSVIEENPIAQIALSCSPFTPSSSWPKEPEDLSEGALASWYARHGFRDDGGSGRRMVRVP